MNEVSPLVMQVLDPTNDLANHAKVVVKLVVDEV